MVIPEKSLLIGHEDVLEETADSAQFLELFSVNISETFQKDLKFRPKPRNPDTYYKGPITTANDRLKTQHRWEVDAVVRDADESLPQGMVDADGNVVINGESVTFGSGGIFGTDGSFDIFVPLGAVKIKYDSETVTNTSKSTILTRGSDYEMDYDKGKIKLLNTADTSLTDSYEIDYTFKGTSEALARTIVRMSQRGGAGVLIYDNDAFTVSSSTASRTDGSVYDVQFETVEINRSGDTPDETRVTLELREAFDSR